MFDRLKQNFRDMGTIKVLCEAAERVANADHQTEPGAEHFVLAALELEDGSAQRVFGKLGIDADTFQRALRESHHAALALAGVGADEINRSQDNVPPMPEPGDIYRAAPSGQAVLQGLAALRKRGVTGPLLGVHVLDVVVAMQHGTTMRAFKLLGRDAASVVAAIRTETVMVA